MGALGKRYWARVRWTDPVTHRRVGVKRSHESREAADGWVERMLRAARTGVDSGQTLATYIDAIGDRWTRGIDPTSTYDPYAAGLKRRVVPTLGHLPVAMITAGLVDRAIDEWETTYGRSTVKNSVAALVLVLDEAVRDGIISRNPAKDRARRRAVGRSPAPEPPASPRDFALPDVAVLERLVARVIEEGRHRPTATSSPSWRPPHCESVRSPASASATSTSPAACCTWTARPTPDGVVWSRSRRRAGAAVRCRSSSLCDPPWPASRLGAERTSCLSWDLAAGSSRRQPCATRRTGTWWCKRSACRVSFGTVFGTPPSRGWPMPASSCTCSSV